YRNPMVPFDHQQRVEVTGMEVLALLSEDGLVPRDGDSLDRIGSEGEPIPCLVAGAAARITAEQQNRIRFQAVAAHPEHFLTYRRDEVEAAAIARRRRRERRRAEAPEHSRSP